MPRPLGGKEPDIRMEHESNDMQQSTLTEKEKDFQPVYDIVVFHRAEVARKVNAEMLQMAWEIGQYISSRIKSSGWGAKVVDELSEYLGRQDPGSRGFGRRNLYNMVEFFDKYSTPEFHEIIQSLRDSTFLQQKRQSEIVQMPSAQMTSPQIVQMPSAQINFTPLPAILTLTSFSNHIEILNRTHGYQEAIFYILYAAQQQLTTKELRRSIVTQTYGSIMSKEKRFTPAMLSQYPGASFLLKDRLILDFLHLSPDFIEPELHEGILKHMRDFILELGKDYVFIGSEYPVKVGGSTKRIDLLFYNRALHCLAAIELKAVDFQAEFVSKMDMYLEALDRDVKKADENPSIGIILCPSIDRTMAEYTLSRSLSPTMVSEYQRKLIPRDVLVKSLQDYCRYLDQATSTTVTP